MKKNKVLKIIIMAIFSICIISNIALARPNIDNIKDDDSSVGGGTEIASMGSLVLTVVTNIGVVTAVVVLAFIGIKYMMGSAEERADYKRSMMPYVIGAVLVFGASGITRMVIGIMS